MTEASILFDRIGRAQQQFLVLHRFRRVPKIIWLMGDDLDVLQDAFGMVVPALGGWPTVMGMRVYPVDDMVRGQVIVSDGDAIGGLGPIVSKVVCRNNIKQPIP